MPVAKGKQPENLKYDTPLYKTPPPMNKVNTEIEIYQYERWLDWVKGG